MTSSAPTGGTARPARPTVYRVRRRRAFLGGALALLLAVTAYGAGGRLLHRTAGALARFGGVPGSPGVRGHGPASAASWPEQGQAALVLGNGRPAASPDERPVPIASVAKVMTAYLTLERDPLSGEEEGFALTVTAADAQAATEEEREGQSVVAVRAGEVLTERQLLEALLIPSGNDIAQMIAVRLAGSRTRFLAEMNGAARSLGMEHTTYTDPSGFDPGTVSTAADQLRVFRQAMRFPVFRQIVSMRRVTLPVAGTLTNFDPLLAVGYAGKTGSDSAAGGCLAFFTRATVGRRWVTAVGVVLGQGQGSDTSELLAAAGEAAERLVGSGEPDGRRLSRAPSWPRRGRRAV